LAAVTETGGAYIQVSDDAILAAVPELARNIGVFAEPAGAAAYAGLVQAVSDGLVQADERIVVLNTGNGLKDIKNTMKAVEMAGSRPSLIAPNMAELKQAIRNLDIQ
jgi:threonine synthase